MFEEGMRALKKLNLSKNAIKMYKLRKLKNELIEFDNGIKDKSYGAKY